MESPRMPHGRAGYSGAAVRAASWALLALAWAGAASVVVLALVLPVPPTAGGAAIAVALALGAKPAMRWLRRRRDAAVYGDAADPAQLLARVGSRLGAGLELGPLADALRETLRLGRIEIHMRRAGEEKPIVGAVSGSASGPGAVLPLHSADGEVGRVVAVAARGGRLDRRTREVLERITGVLALAVRLSEENRELREARERLDQVAAEERRIMRRELGEGIVPALAEAVRELEAAAAGIGESSGGSAGPDGFARVRESLAERTGEIRDLARTLLPGALDAGDLAGALRELGPRFAREGVEVRVRDDALDGVGPARQVALYHFVAEAVLLTRRLASRVEITVSAGAGGRTVILAGALRGDIDRRAAADRLPQLRERVAELSGTLEHGRDTDGLSELRAEVPK